MRCQDLANSFHPIIVPAVEAAAADVADANEDIVSRLCSEKPTERVVRTQIDPLQEY
jgi:hypothetical protein